MQLKFKHLNICILSAMLTACGGGSDENNNNGTDSDISPPTSTAYPEPLKDIQDDSVLGFYDTDQDGKERPLRNDLTGDFEAMIQFAQSHTVDPNGNETKVDETKRMPRLTSEKDALLLVTPLITMGEISQLFVEAYHDGQWKKVELREPSQLAESDQNNTDNRPKVTYSRKVWSIALPWNWVQPGLSLRVTDGKRSGNLRTEDIDFAPPAEIYVQNIRLGMLTKDVPLSHGNYIHHMLLEPANAGSDFLQTIPAAQITVSRYDDQILSKVMVANGTIYTEKSAGDGGVHTGDMRENTAKSTYSTGINLANWGATSSNMNSQQQPQLTQGVVLHHAKGLYQNGQQLHANSGSNGMLTLYRSFWNEFSHEIGHQFGQSHMTGPTIGACQNADSGWGYIAYRNRMHGNLKWSEAVNSSESAGCTSYKDKNGNKLFAYNQDPMNSGNPGGALSQYVSYTGHSAYKHVQPAMNKPMWATNSPTGYKQWNKDTRQMEVFQPKVPNTNQVWYNSADGNYLKPTQFGVPVFTILGGYDPDNQIGLLYPAARGNWGNTFSLPQANTTAMVANCWINVKYAVKAEENIALAPNRLGGGGVVNKLHINLAQSDAPRSVDLYCKKANDQAIKLSSIEIPVYTQPLPDVVILGKSHGYDALRKIELPTLEQALLNSQNKPLVSLNANEQLLYESYKNYRNELSTTAQLEFDRYADQQDKLYRLNRWINAYRADLVAEKPQAITAFKNFTTVLKLQNDDPLAGKGSLNLPKLANNGCLKVETLSDNKLNVYVSGKNGCTGDASEEWIYDATGKIHNQKHIDQCLTSSGQLAQCANNQSSQAWIMDQNTQQIRQGNQCLDVYGGGNFGDSGRGSITRYTCGSGNNQKWTLLQPNNSFMLLALNSRNLSLVINVLKVSSE